MLSGQGITPLPEKLESIQNMPSPRNPKEIKQFLGLVGFYCTFIPRYADIVGPMTALTKNDVEFKWTTQCHKAFNLLEKRITTEPILKYPALTGLIYYLLMQENMVGLCQLVS